MSKAFISKKDRYHPFGRALFSVLLSALILVFVIVSTGQISETTKQEQLHSAELSIRRAAIQCYAIEGRYPGTLEYLTDNYGIVLDRSRFVYHYYAVGANLVPQISVFYLE